MIDLTDLLLSPGYRQEGFTIEEIQESDDIAVLVLRHRGKEIVRTSSAGLIISNIVRVITQEVSKN